MKIKPTKFKEDAEREIPWCQREIESCKQHIAARHNSMVFDYPQRLKDYEAKLQRAQGLLALLETHDLTITMHPSTLRDSRDLKGDYNQTVEIEGVVYNVRVGRGRRVRIAFQGGRRGWRWNIDIFCKPLNKMVYQDDGPRSPGIARLVFQAHVDLLLKKKLPIAPPTPVPTAEYIDAMTPLTGAPLVDPRPKSAMALQAEKRPANYESLPQDEQWAIDKALGILDWDGK